MEEGRNCVTVGVMGVLGIDVGCEASGRRLATSIGVVGFANTSEANGAIYWIVSVDAYALVRHLPAIGAP